MRTIQIGNYIHFGEIDRWLLGANEGIKIHGEGGIVYGINEFISYLEEFELPVSLRASSRLIEFRDKISKSKTDHKLTVEEAANLTLIMGDIEKVLNIEAEAYFAYLVTDKRIDVKKLLHDVSALFAPNVFMSLPEIAQYDFKEAGKCIAFECPTAAAFHLLRGTEGMLRHFYCSFVKRGRVKDLLWGLMIQHLNQLKQKKYQKKKLPDPLLQNLNNIRLSFRNLTQHPD